MTERKGNAARDRAARSRPAHIGAAQIRLLERLCNACAVSGDEGEVRAIVLEQTRPLADEIKVDALGSVLAVHKGVGESRLRVMFAAHMDEVGMMITQDEGEGVFRFETVGGVDVNRLAGKAVWIGRSRVPGVIGVKPIHLSEFRDFKRRLSLEDLRIDVSPDGARKVKVGDRATFATTFRQLGPSLQAKALDDRLGVATLIELFHNAPENIDMLAAFTVQEEAGLRGAKAAAYAFNPDLAIVLDCTPAYDLPSFGKSGFRSPEEENYRYNTRLGAGPALYIADRATISDPRLVRHFIRTGDDLGIPYQFRQTGGGGTDAGAIHRQRGGVPSISVSVPGRYPHTGALMARLEDWQNTMTLVDQAVRRLTPEILEAER